MLPAPSFVPPHEFRVLFFQSTMANPVAACHQAVGKGNWLEVDVLLNVLEPQQTVQRGVLEGVHSRFSSFLKGLQGGLNGLVFCKRAC